MLYRDGKLMFVEIAVFLFLFLFFFNAVFFHPMDYGKNLFPMGSDRVLFA